MKVAVCVNHVPDTETKIKVGADGVSIDRAGVNYMLSPYDEFAVEEALRMRDKFKGEVIAVSLGPDQHKETLRKALAMGVDKAVLLKDDSPRESCARSLRTPCCLANSRSTTTAPRWARWLPKCSVCRRSPWW
jgi:electron transfer flavoprotein beta subunit